MAKHFLTLSLDQYFNKLYQDDNPFILKLNPLLGYGLAFYTTSGNYHESPYLGKLQFLLNQFINVFGFKV